MKTENASSVSTYRSVLGNFLTSVIFLRQTQARPADRLLASPIVRKTVFRGELQRARSRSGPVVPPTDLRKWRKPRWLRSKASTDSPTLGKDEQARVPSFAIQ